MNKNEIRENLLRLLENNGIILPEEIDEEMFIDSIQFITAICDIEDCFSIELPDDYLLLENFKNIDQIVDTIDLCIKT